MIGMRYLNLLVTLAALAVHGCSAEQQTKPADMQASSEKVTEPNFSQSIAKYFRSGEEGEVLRYLPPAEVIGVRIQAANGRSAPVRLPIEVFYCVPHIDGSDPVDKASLTSAIAEMNVNLRSSLKGVSRQADRLGIDLTKCSVESVSVKPSLLVADEGPYSGKIIDGFISLHCLQEGTPKKFDILFETFNSSHIGSMCFINTFSVEQINEFQRMGAALTEGTFDAKMATKIKTFSLVRRQIYQFIDGAVKPDDYKMNEWRFKLKNKDVAVIHFDNAGVLTDITIDGP